MARFVSPGMVERGELQFGTDAHARALTWSTNIIVTVCGGFTLNSGRPQHTMSAWWEPENNLKMLLKDEKNTGDVL